MLKWAFQAEEKRIGDNRNLYKDRNSMVTCAYAGTYSVNLFSFLNFL